MKILRRCVSNISCLRDIAENLNPILSTSTEFTKDEKIFLEGFISWIDGINNNVPSIRERLAKENSKPRTSTREFLSNIGQTINQTLIDIEDNKYALLPVEDFLKVMEILNGKNIDVHLNHVLHDNVILLLL